MKLLMSFALVLCLSAFCLAGQIEDPGYTPPPPCTGPDCPATTPTLDGQIEDPGFLDGLLDSIFG